MMPEEPEGWTPVKFVYFFDGSGGCDLCSSLTGWYDDRPELPHPNCDCSVEEYIYIGSCNLYYEDKSEDVTEDEEELFCGTLTNTSDSKCTAEATYSKTVTGEISVSATIEKIFSVSAKYSESHTLSIGAAAELEPGQSVEVYAAVIWRTVSFHAKEKWICENYLGDEDYEIEGEEFDEEIRVPTREFVVRYE